MEKTRTERPKEMLQASTTLNLNGSEVGQQITMFENTVLNEKIADLINIGGVMQEQGVIVLLIQWC